MDQMVDGNIVVCKNCKNKCLENDQYCPKCHFRLKFNENIAFKRKKKLEQSIILPTFEMTKGKSQDSNKNPFEFSQSELNMSLLRTEAEFNLYVFRSYFLSSLFFFLFSILLISIFKFNTDLASYLLINFLASYVILGPLFVLISTSFKKQKFYYDILTYQEIIKQIKEGKFYFFKQNANHYIFRKDTAEIISFPIVLIFEENFFLIYGPKKVVDRLRVANDWPCI